MKLIVEGITQRMKSVCSTVVFTHSSDDPNKKIKLIAVSK